MCHDPNILVNWTQAQFPSKNSNSCSPLGEHCHNQGYLCWLAMMSLKCCGAPLPDAFQGKAALWRSSCYDSALSVCFYSKTSDLALTKAIVPHWDETGTAFFFLKNVFECSLFLFLFYSFYSWRNAVQPSCSSSPAKGRIGDRAIMVCSFNLVDPAVFLHWREDSLPLLAARMLQLTPHSHPNELEFRIGWDTH